MKIVLAFLLVTIIYGSHLCNTCIRLTELLQNTLIKITPMFIAKDVVKSVCQRQYQSEQLCKNIANQLTPLALTMGFRGVIKTGRICNQFCPKGFYSKLNLQKEIGSIVTGDTIESFKYVNQLPYQTEKIRINSGTTKFMHLTDVHLDFNYTVNSSIICDLPICCHANNGFPEADSSKASEYGSSKCDAPLKLFNSALEFMKKQMSDIDGVIMTGDFSAHNQWQKTPESVVSVRKFVQQQIDSTLGVKLITAPGNNQYLPDHQVDPTTYPEESLKLIQLINDDGKILTFISLNTLYCDIINLYLIQDQTMAIRQLKTLDKILSQKQNVYLLGHIAPTSPSCSQSYSLLFRAIITKHQKKIKGQFYGHTHLDQFIVNTDPRNNQTATSFGLSAGSFSPLGTNQPRIRVYEITHEFDLINYNDYAFSMTKHQWGLYYNFKEYYGLPIDQPINGKLLQQLQNNMVQDIKIRQKYSAKASLGGGKYYCQTFDTKQKRLECSGSDLGFRGRITDVLSLIQGPWGSYGDQVQ